MKYVAFFLQGARVTLGLRVSPGTAEYGFLRERRPALLFRLLLSGATALRISMAHEITRPAGPNVPCVLLPFADHARAQGHTFLRRGLYARLVGGFLTHVRRPGRRPPGPLVGALWGGGPPSPTQPPPRGTAGSAGEWGRLNAVGSQTGPS